MNLSIATGVGLILAGFFLIYNKIEVSVNNELKSKISKKEYYIQERISDYEWESEYKYLPD